MGTRNPIGGPFRRRVRKPLPLALRRPVRWIEGNSASGTDEVPTITSFSFTPTLDTSTWPAAGGTELVFGDDDLDWMDANEATIERIVGDISVSAFYLSGSDPDLSPQIHHAFVRMGLLVVQEVEDIAAWVPPSLWDREAIEEYEWMWMWQGMLRETQQNFPTVPVGTSRHAWFLGTDDQHIDLHVRRKLGKKDHLVLLGQFGCGTLLEDASLGVSAVHLLRVLFKTK